jgi:membrane protease YdiL (CAAX protease family)
MKSRIRSFAVLAAAGTLGILALLGEGFLNPAQYEELAAEVGTNPELVLFAAAVQTFILMAVAIVAGLWAAPKLGFDSHLVNRVTDGSALLESIQSEFKPALGVGGAIGVMLIVAERIAPEISNGEEYEMSVELLVQSVPLRLFYGGITEELLLRWGVMSLIVLLVWRLHGRRGDSPSAGIVWIGIVIAAILFGVGHLPMAASIYGALTVEVLAFVVGANAIGGIGFGWLFWRYSLEAAIIAHAFAHVVAVTIWVALLLV